MVPKKKTPEVPEAAEEPRVCEFEKYECVRVHRREIKGAPYNPRHMGTEARKKLWANLKDRGLMHPLPWNRRTGFLVGGHQRLNVLDSLMGTDNYTLTMAVVDLDPTAEREQNIFMNNPLAQGDWDMAKLEDVFADGIKPEIAGFTAVDTFRLFGKAPDSMGVEKYEEIANHFHDLDADFERIRKSVNDRDDPDFYIVLVFDSYASRKQLTDVLGLDDNRYQDARVVLAAMEKGVKV